MAKATESGEDTLKRHVKASTGDVLGESNLGTKII
jgi:hypothetical protein